MRNVVQCFVIYQLLIGSSMGQSNTLGLQGAKLYPVSGAPIERGVIVIEDGKIKAVGPEDSVLIPPNSRVEVLNGKTIIPGLVDTHLHIGILSRPSVPANIDGNESSGPVQPALRTIDAIWPADPGIRLAQAGGVTTAMERSVTSTFASKNCNRRLSLANLTSVSKRLKVSQGALAEDASLQRKLRELNNQMKT